MNHKQLIQEASLEKKDFVFIRFQNKTIHKMDEELCSNQIQIYTYTTKSIWKWTQRTTEKDRENSKKKTRIPLCLSVEQIVEESLKNKKYMLKGVCSQYPIAGS